MKSEEDNASKTNRLDKQFSISIILALAIFMAGGSTATHDSECSRPSLTEWRKTLMEKILLLKQR